jgi:SAM-dependent methyltransferase
MILRSRFRIRFDPAQYELETFRNSGGAAVSEFEVSSICRLLVPLDGGIILDVGMGPGRVFRRLVDQGTHLVGVDADRNMIRHVARSFRVSSKNEKIVDFVVADAESLPFRPNTFAAIICIRLLKYLTNSKKGIEEMCSALGPGGRLVLEFPNYLGPNGLLKLPQFITVGRVYPAVFRLSRVRKNVSDYGVLVDMVIGWHKFPLAFLVMLNNRRLVESILRVEAIIQRMTPPEFMSRSVVISGVKGIMATPVP